MNNETQKGEWGFEEELRLKVQFDRNQDREVCILFIRRLLAEAEEKGRKAAADYIENRAVTMFYQDDLSDLRQGDVVVRRSDIAAARNSH